MILFTLSAILCILFYFEFYVISVLVTRWREYFSTLLNRPLVDPPHSLTQAASEAMVDPSISI